MSESETVAEKTTAPVEQQAYKKGKRYPQQQHYQQHQSQFPGGYVPPHLRKKKQPVYVEDLREKLNRQRAEKEGQGTSFSGPPPDPNYNFLRDPARDAGESTAAPPERRQQYNQNRRPNNDPRNRHYPNRPPQRPTTIQPVNIKVELSTSTGQRSCVVDEEHKLPEIKHVPDMPEQRTRKFHNSRYYRNAATPQQQQQQPQQQQQQQQQQQRRPPPPWKQNKRGGGGGGGFKGGERREERKKGEEVPVLKQQEEGGENWDAPTNDDGGGGKTEVGGLATTDDVSEAGNLNAAAEEPEELYENAEDEEGKAENEEKVAENEGQPEENAKETAKTEVGNTSKEPEEADLKETIIIEATKK